MAKSAAANTKTKREDAKAPQRELALAFRRVFRTLNRMRGRDTHLAGSELSNAQYELLIELDERGELSAGELAVAARLAPGTVTQMLDALAESGYVERDRSQADRRVVVSRLTPEAHRQIEAKRATWEERWEQALADFSPRELAAATTVLERLGEMFERASEGATSEESSRAPSPQASGGRKPA
jgi:DNA-binding MarR family transcriptional regulator